MNLSNVMTAYLLKINYFNI